MKIFLVFMAIVGTVINLSFYIGAKSETVASIAAISLFFVYGFVVALWPDRSDDG